MLITEEEKKKSWTWAFKQQTLQAWQPIPTLNSTIIIFFCLTAIYAILGFVLWSYQNSV